MTDIRQMINQGAEEFMAARLNADSRRRLNAARAKLREAQLYLASVRASEFVSIADIRRCEKYVCLEIDRCWEAQCMAKGVFG
jgi:hypothetical protein